MQTTFDIPPAISLDTSFPRWRGSAIEGLLPPQLCEEISDELLERCTFSKVKGSDKGYSFQYHVGGLFYPERRRPNSWMHHDLTELPPLAYSTFCSERMLDALRSMVHNPRLRRDQFSIGFNAMYVGDFIGSHVHPGYAATVTFCLVSAKSGGSHISMGREQTFRQGDAIGYRGDEPHEVLQVTEIGKKPRLVVVANIYS